MNEKNLFSTVAFYYLTLSLISECLLCLFAMNVWTHGRTNGERFAK